MQILNQRQIQQKIRRLAYQIMENNIDESEIVLAGINNNGMGFAQMILDELVRINKTKIPIQLIRIHLSPADPLSSPIKVEVPIEELEDKVIIVIDDVANTGRTLFYAIKPILNTIPKKVEVAVLVDRMHKSFPIKIDYVGLTLATTLKENIEVKIREVEELSVYLN